MADFMFSADIKELLYCASSGSAGFEVPLSGLTRWKVGGSAAAVVEPRTVNELASVLQVIRDRELKYCVVGETSNLLFDSDGFRGVLVRMAEKYAGIEVNGTRMSVRAGTSVPQVARAAAAHGLSGIEHIVGIPGTMGGLVLMNGGSQRKGIGDHVASVTLLSPLGERIQLTHDECEFSYRSSALQKRRDVVVGVELTLVEGDAEAISSEMDEIVSARSRKFPEREANCGSTFLSDPAMYATVGPPGRVIEKLGFKGMTLGGAQVAPEHANFINNVNSASSDDILRLIGLIRGTVFEETGFHLDAEVRYVSPEGDMSPAHIVADKRGFTHSIHKAPGTRVSDGH